MEGGRLLRDGDWRHLKKDFSLIIRVDSELATSTNISASVWARVTPENFEASLADHLHNSPQSRSQSLG